MAFRTFEDIKAWQHSRELNKFLHEICKCSSVQRDKNWIDQLTSASNSIMANIAEGNDSKSDVEFARFLGYAKRSSTEVRSHLYYALDKNYITQKEFDVLAGKTTEIAATLSGLMNYLYKSKKKLRSQGVIRD